MSNVFPTAEPSRDDRLAIVVSRWNESITQKLLDGAITTLTSRGIPDAAIDVAWVPGAWEIPLVAQRLADSHRYRAVSSAISEIGLETGVPVLFGVLTCESMEQAIHRAGGNVGNKGAECADAALAMIGLMKNLPPT